MVSLRTELAEHGIVPKKPSRRAGTPAFIPRRGTPVWVPLVQKGGHAGPPLRLGMGFHSGRLEKALRVKGERTPFFRYSYPTTPTMAALSVQKEGEGTWILIFS